MIAARRPHWYFISYRECAICMDTEETRERRYDPRPEEWDKRHETDTYACSSHFL